MINDKWYLVCDIKTKTARDLIQLPAVYGSTTGLGEQSDEDLENFHLWTPYRTTSFLTEDRAIELGYDQDSIADVLIATHDAVLSWVRSMRDLLLTATDVLVVPDRWESLDVVDKNYAILYRQALRDLTSVPDLLKITWPAIPPVLDFIRAVDYSHIERPSNDFVTTLVKPFPEPSLQERRDNQWLRIKDERDRRKAAGVKVTVDGKDYWFQTDDPTRNQYALIDGKATRNGATGSTVLTKWKTMSKVFVPLTLDLLHQVIDNGTDNEEAIFMNAEKHNAAVMASDDPEHYDYSTGWPQTYAEYVKATTP